MTINQQKLRSVMAQFIADVEEYLSEHIDDDPEACSIAGNSDPETKLVLQAVQTAVDDFWREVTEAFSFDDPPEPAKPPLRPV
jgi:hypothetical protein